MITPSNTIRLNKLVSEKDTDESINFHIIYNASDLHSNSNQIVLFSDDFNKAIKFDDHNNESFCQSMHYLYDR